MQFHTLSTAHDGGGAARNASTPSHPGPVRDDDPDGRARNVPRDRSLDRTASMSAGKNSTLAKCQWYSSSDRW